MKKIRKPNLIRLGNNCRVEYRIPFHLTALNEAVHCKWRQVEVYDIDRKHGKGTLLWGVVSPYSYGEDQHQLALQQMDKKDAVALQTWYANGSRYAIFLKTTHKRNVEEDIGTAIEKVSDKMCKKESSATVLRSWNKDASIVMNNYGNKYFMELTWNDSNSCYEPIRNNDYNITSVDSDVVNGDAHVKYHVTFSSDAHYIVESWKHGNTMKLRVYPGDELKGETKSNG